MLTQGVAGDCGGLRGYFQPITREKNFFERSEVKSPPQPPAIPRKLRGGGCTE